MKGKINLQDAFLNQLRKEKISVNVYLVNGIKLTGKVGGFDNFTIILTSGNGQQLIFKHAISTISPVKSQEVLNFAQIAEKETV